MDKKPQFVWALAVGAGFVVIQVLIFLIRFGRLDPDARLADYIWFFIGGALTGAALIYFWQRAADARAVRAILIAYGVSLPFALFGMVLGGVVGPMGLLMLGVSPSVFVTGLTYYIGRYLASRKTT